MKNDGVMYSITGSYAFHKGIMLKVEGQGDWGKVQYASTGTGDYSGINDYIVELRLLGGYDFLIAKDVTITPYVGFGYRWLNDDASDVMTTSGYRGYLRESNYYYSPAGIYIETNFELGWILGLAIEYDFFWKGIQKSRMEDVGAARNFENSQPAGYGLRAALSCRKTVDLFDCVIEPYVTYWNVDRSRSTASGGSVYWEPENNTLQYGVKLGVFF